MIDKFLELLERVELILLITIVELFQVLLDFFTIVKKAHFQKIEKKKKIEFFAFLESNLILVKDDHQSRDLSK